MLTLKLAQITFPGSDGPYSWRYTPPGSSTAASALTGRAQFRYEGDTQADANGDWREIATGGSDGNFVIDVSDYDTLPDNLVEHVEILSNPSDEVVTWIPGVTQVMKLGGVDPTSKAMFDVLNGDDERFAHLLTPGAGIETHTWLGAEKKTIRQVLQVQFGGAATRYMLVERAWLLGPDGGTIDKLAP